MPWVTIPDGDIDPESPIDSPLMAALRDNPIAIAGGMAGAPKVQNGALAGLPWIQSNLAANSVGASQLISGNVQATHLAAAAVQRAKLQTTTVSLSGSISIGSHVDITLSAYAFFPMIHTTFSGTAGNHVKLSGHGTDGASADLPRFRLSNEDSSNSNTYDIDYRYINV